MEPRTTTHGARLRNDVTGETRDVTFHAGEASMSHAEHDAFAQHGRIGERLVSVWREAGTRAETHARPSSTARPRRNLNGCRRR
jgi:hypothetical protein